jgi:hypothetical protein
VRAAAGSAATGLYVSFTGVPDASLERAGRRFLNAFAATQPWHAVVSSAATYAAQGADVLLAAIADSNGTRCSVTGQLRATKVEHGILASFSFNPRRRHPSRPGHRLPNRRQSRDQLAPARRLRRSRTRPRHRPGTGRRRIEGGARGRVGSRAPSLYEWNERSAARAAW